MNMGVDNVTKPGKDVWVFAEQVEGRIEDSSLEVIEAAGGLVDKLGGELCIVLIGNKIDDLQHELSRFGVDKLYILENPLLTSYDGEAYTEALSTLLADKSGILLCDATLKSKDLVPRLAAKLKTGLISDCTSLNLDADVLLHTKLIYNNRLQAMVINSTGLKIATLLPGAKFGKNLPRRQAKIAEVIRNNQQLLFEKHYRRLSIKKGDPKTMSILEADIIVAGGRGVGSAQNWKLLDEFAEVLGGCVAGSRLAVDAGWIPYERQVGQTGKIVAPKLYIACGISGASNHVLGVKNSKYIVAINKDPNAEFFKLADLCIVGDLTQVIPALIEQIRNN